MTERHKITDMMLALTPLPRDKILKIYSHMCNTWAHVPEIAVTALGRIISGYTAM